MHFKALQGEEGNKTSNLYSGAQISRFMTIVHTHYLTDKTKDAHSNITSPFHLRLKVTFCKFRSESVA